MIDHLRLKNVGLFPELDVQWAKRLNVITGDNGLGKSFLLDIAWWALTRTWVSHAAFPNQIRESAKIEYSVHGVSKSVEAVSTFDRNNSSWPLKAARPTKQGIVVYVRVDGGFSVWDPARNYWRTDKGRPDAYHFQTEDVWEGLDIDGVRVCEGLERDWVSWQKGNEPQFEALCEVLRTLSPDGEVIKPGLPTRVFIGEGRDRPTLVLAGQTIPVALASSGVRRILALAYFLVWAWYEHSAAAELLGKDPERRLILLFDEPETHLHPKWQRTILPSVLTAVETLRGKNPTEPQLIVATHSALILASLEPYFDDSKDDLLSLDIEDGRVALRQGRWTKQGDVRNWLVSEVFGLEQARSKPAEKAIEAAEAFMRGEPLSEPGFSTRDEIHHQLLNVLPGHDEFWPRWLVKTGIVDND